MIGPACTATKSDLHSQH